MRELDFAGRAPSGPEIEQHDLATVAGQIDFFAAQTGPNEIRRWFVDQRGGMRARADSQAENGDE